MSPNLDNSEPIDVFKVSKFPQVKGLNKALYIELLNAGLYLRKPKPSQEKKAKSYVQTIILNLFDAYLSDEKKFIGYSRSEGSYQQGSRYNKLFISYSTFIRVVDKLIELNYVEHYKGFHNRNTGFGRQSRMCATDKLIKQIKRHKIEQKMIQRDTSKEEIIVLKDERKKLIEYEDTVQTHRMRKNLMRINKSLEQSFIGLFISDELFEKLKSEMRKKQSQEPVNFNFKQLRRVFNNGNFNDGGRFYRAWWQNIPRKYRKFIVIGYIEDSFFNYDNIFNQATIELAYKSHHARMLYKEVGVDFGKKDPFIFKDFDSRLRGVFKEAFYTMLNANSRPSAMSAVRKSLQGRQFPDGLTITAKEVLGTIEECRVKIKDFFYSGIGVELQNKDAKIAERIMLEMLDNQCIALTMHDSFIVNGYEEDKLRDCMESAFLDVVGVKCEISKKWTLDQWENRYPKSYDRFFENGGFDTFYGNYYSWLVDQGLRGAYKKGQFF